MTTGSGEEFKAALDRLRTWAEQWRDVEGDDSELQAARDFLVLDHTMVHNSEPWPDSHESPGHVAARIMDLPDTILSDDRKQELDVGVAVYVSDDNGDLHYGPTLDDAKRAFELSNQAKANDRKTKC